ncbi:transcriptional regulator [Rhizobium sp. Leaf384]|uniref:helix-turn-helix domain-containing protein n=1 Tax=Rhizobium sp. Leaf384 TaxID=1736358 RepID=UPI0007157E44|nr:helix-turn-helix domain-containing protein [Rhizobium sp. Leaf384]KQS78814.1 transcriptional regulator [Rhizobium sp. Leaf384]
MPKEVSSRDKRVVALAYNGLCTFEFGIVSEVFGLERPELEPGWYRFTVCAEHPGRLETNVGITIDIPNGLECLQDAGTIIIPGWNLKGPEPSQNLCDTLIAAHGRGARLVSICSGAFLLAATGLLAHRTATTHWKHGSLLRSLYPAVHVDDTALYTDDVDILTSAGSAAGIDLLLHMIRKDIGPEAANSVARRMVTAGHRLGGQAQFIERPKSIISDDRLGALLDRVQRELEQPWNMETMAGCAVMSKRTFARKFKAVTGVSPGAWLNSERLALARDLLERTKHSLDSIAEETGLGTAANMRLHFNKAFGISPDLYRRQFAHLRQPTGTGSKGRI